VNHIFDINYFLYLIIADGEKESYIICFLHGSYI